MANITDLKKYGKNDSVAWADVSGKPTLGTLAAKNSVAWSEVTNKPSSFTPSSHSHAISEVTNLQSTLDGKQDKIAANTYAPYSTKTAVDTLNAGKTTAGSVDYKIDQAMSKLADNSTVTNLTGRVEALENAFGSIEYDYALGAGESLEDGSVRPTAYRVGGEPAIPEPRRDGWAFKGWSGTRDGSATTWADLFKAKGVVKLTAQWERTVPQADYFFTTESPYDAASTGDPKAWTIAVRLTGDAGRTLNAASFSKKASDLFGAAADDITFTVGTDKTMAGGTSTTVGWDEAVSNVAMTALDGGGYGVYVRISIPQGGIDADRVVASYTGGSYVASLVKMNYEFA